MSDPKLIVDDLRARAGEMGNLLRDNPVGLAVGSVAVGFLVGLLLPRTTLETDRMRDMKRKAVDAGKNAIEAGKRTLQETVRSAIG